MWKKLNGKITKFLYYIRNNFISFIFKLSVFTIMLILIYLVCILRQADSAKLSEYSDVHPLESSQKLMLTTPTEISINLDGLPSTTEATLTIDNIIPKAEMHQLFPIQEQTTTQRLTIDETTAASLDQQTTEETRVIPSPEPEIPIEEPQSTEELNTSTTESLRKSTTPEPNQSEEQFSTFPETIIANTPIEIIATINYTTTPSPTPPTTTEIAQADGLFMDNWSNYLPTYEDSQVSPPEETSSPLNSLQEKTDSLFLNEEEVFSTMEAPSIPKDTLEEVKIPHSAEELTQTQDIFKSSNKDTIEEKMVPLKTSPILSPRNLLDLFTFDHLPSSSNVKATWWPKSNIAPLSKSAAVKNPRKLVKNKKRHANAIRPIEDSNEMNQGSNFFNQLNQFQDLDTLLNEKLKDSVDLLERLFGKFN